jgi:hypothetical protein
VLNACLLLFAAVIVYPGIFPNSSAAVAKDKKTDEIMSVEAAPNDADVYYFRSGRFTGKLRTYTVFCDEPELVDIQNGRYFNVKLAPGKHIFRSEDGRKKEALSQSAAHKASSTTVNSGSGSAAKQGTTSAATKQSAPAIRPSDGDYADKTSDGDDVSFTVRHHRLTGIFKLDHGGGLEAKMDSPRHAREADLSSGSIRISAEDSAMAYSMGENGQFTGRIGNPHLVWTKMVVQGKFVAKDSVRGSVEITGSDYPKPEKFTWEAKRTEVEAIAP